MYRNMVCTVQTQGEEKIFIQARGRNRTLLLWSFVILRIGSLRTPYSIDVHPPHFVGSVANARSRENNYSPWVEENKELRPALTGACMAPYRMLSACKEVLILLIIIKMRWGGREGFQGLYAGEGGVKRTRYISRRQNLWPDNVKDNKEGKGRCYRYWIKIKLTGYSRNLRN